MPILDEVRITELPGADPLAGPELIPLVQSGVTKSRSAQNLVLDGGLQAHLDAADPHTQYLKESEYEAHRRSREDLLKQATLSLDFANNKYEVYEGPVNSLTQMPFNTALDFTRASSATARTATGKIQGVLTDEQRLVGNREGLLIEEQRTNVITRSQPTVADNYWQVVTDTTLSNVTLAGLPALRVTRDVEVGELSAVLSSPQGNESNTCVRTCVVKVSDPQNQYLKLRIYTEAKSDPNYHVTFDLSSEEAVYRAGWNRLDGLLDIKKLSPGVFSLIVTQSSTRAYNNQWIFKLSSKASASDFTLDDNPQGSWFEFTACQREELVGFPSSYIPTAGTQVTRAADNCSRALGQEYNTSEGTFVVSYTRDYETTDPFDHAAFNIKDASDNDYSLERSDTSIRLRSDLTPYETNLFDVPYTAGTESVCALSWGSGKPTILAADGVANSSASSGNSGAQTLLANATIINMNRRKGSTTRGYFYYIPRALSEAELITLTGGT